ncbi:MAG: hypothetical protein WBA67_13830, partial [Jannaschia sp.]
LLVRACPMDLLSNLRPVALSVAVAEALPMPSRVVDTPDGVAMFRAIVEMLRGSAVEGAAGSH